jgi:pilus assembly protein Flp/PilA
MWQFIKRRPGLVRDRRGITALEYGIIASALAFVFIAAFTSLGSPLSIIFASVGSKL